MWQSHSDRGSTEALVARSSSLRAARCEPGEIRAPQGGILVVWLDRGSNPAESGSILVTSPGSWPDRIDPSGAASDTTTIPSNVPGSGRCWQERARAGASGGDLLEAGRSWEERVGLRGN